MQKRSGVWLALLLLLATPAWPQETPAARPFWETRPYSEWKSSELIQFFTDSPWSRPATMLEPSTQVTLGAPRYVVQWYSAQVMREALVRHSQLVGRAEPQVERAFLDSPHDSYELYIFAAVLTADRSLRVVHLEPFEGMTEPEIQQATLLRFSRQEHSSRPDGVQLLRDVQTQELRGVRLIFTRAREAVPSGQATDGQAQLTCGTRQGTLSVRFALSAMQRGGQPDL
ncbi:MAG TPA: hypothetical protein VNN18_12795 [Candidatus Xenobia bacterium]|nr:hypothetical protein [Candidatus Xenobia bacterium]